MPVISFGLSPPKFSRLSGRLLPPAHHEVERPVQQALALEAAARFLLDDVQAPEGEKDVHVVVHRRRPGGQREDRHRLVEIPAHADQG
jgi:hypothetical protein